MGRIFDIQRYSLHDGSGIRTIVFFAGCFLRCKWCCNPESHYAVNRTSVGPSPYIINEMSVDDVMAVVERDRPYYRRSGGGLTLSGGEILTQPDFARDLLREAQKSGIHTAVESTALADFRDVEKILPYLDLFLLDIKHTDQAKHEKFTGRRNGLALENAVKIAAYARRTMSGLIIRVPVIPGFNQTVQEIKEIAGFAAELSGVDEIHLLPYHRMGEGKYATLGLEYPMGDVPPPSDDEMENLKAVVESTTSLRCTVGG